MNLAVAPAWIAVDWGSSFVRAWAMSQSGQILAANSSDQGAAKLHSTQFEAVLLNLIQDWLPSTNTVKVLICGMAGSRQGWQEAAYLPIPLKLTSDLSASRVASHDSRIQVSILPGLKQLETPDVMRGEETQLLGFIQQQPDFNGVVSLPGTHNKWVRVQAQQISQFSTCMTGELFELLAEHSVLRHSLQSSDWDAPAFDAAFLATIAKPQAFMQRLFTLRARDLLQGTPKAQARAQLSGELIGLEISAMQEAGFISPTLPLAFIGSRKLCDLYLRALNLLGIEAQAYAAEHLTVQGLAAAYQELRS
ncbi:MAG: 2-dehydro-3-deoxygalactonokinase [Thiothrix sp.]|nr:MAG: 2-dehydro-3-deoxygalactonokinase [Thiothrix sp.]